MTGLELGSMMETATMAVGLESRDAVVYKARRDGSSAMWELVDSVSGSSFALSGDGKTLAVVSAVTLGAGVDKLLRLPLETDLPSAMCQDRWICLSKDNRCLFHPGIFLSG